MKLNSIILSGNYTAIKDELESIQKKYNDKSVDNLLMHLEKISKTFLHYFENDIVLKNSLKKYVNDVKIRKYSVEKYAENFIKNLEDVKNKAILASKHRDTRVRRISAKNKTLRFLKNNFSELIHFLTLYDAAIAVEQNIIKEAKRSPDILPVAGAGQEGTDILVKKYKKDTPGQLTEDAECHLFSFNEIKDLEKFADRLLNKFGVDIQFTKHFAERMSSDRNHPCIKLAELQSLFKRIEANKAEKIKKHPNGEFVIVDAQKDLNLPVVISYKNGEFDVVMKTIMRKKNFLSTSPKIRVESFMMRNKL